MRHYQKPRGEQELIPGVKLVFRSLRTRLIVLLAVLVLVPVLAGFAIYTRSAAGLIERQLIESQSAVLSQTVLNLNRVIGTVNTSVNYLSSSSAVQHYIETTEPVDTAAGFFAVRDLQDTMRVVSTAGFQHTMDIFFLTPTGFVSTIVDARRNRNEFLNSRWFERANSHPERIHWTLETQRTGMSDGLRASKMLTAARAIRSYGGGGVAGVAAVSIDSRDFTLVIDPRMIIRDGAEILIQQEVVTAPLRVLSAGLENGWTIEYPLSGDLFLGDLAALQRRGLAMILLLGILLSAVIVWNVFSGTRSLLLLRRSAAEVAAGNLTARAPDLPKDEIGLLAEQFNRMLDQIGQLFEQVRREHDLAEEARMARLRSQIRPHFLLNSLNSVNLAARMSGADNVCDIIAALSSILERSLYERETTVPLSREIQTTRDFITLERLRSGDRWNIEIDADGVVGDPLCPVFCIQPLVENAVQHAVPSSRTVQLHVTVSFCCLPQASPKVLEIVVADDGVGFPEKSRGGLPEPSPTGGIGLRNIHERIRSQFGPDWGITIEPRNPAGSRVTVRLPYRSAVP
ncbi:MAG: HAMP domain-containing protein [Spirochaetaceae bacterium]|nr:MAG: HAMP domain-containing protein [Spirochaetaceae bacterium]